MDNEMEVAWRKNLADPPPSQLRHGAELSAITLAFLMLQGVCLHLAVLLLEHARARSHGTPLAKEAPRVLPVMGGWDVALEQGIVPCRTIQGGI